MKKKKQKVDSKYECYHFMILMESMNVKFSLKYMPISSD